MKKKILTLIILFVVFYICKCTLFSKVNITDATTMIKDAITIIINQKIKLDQKENKEYIPNKEYTPVPISAIQLKEKNKRKIFKVGYTNDNVNVRKRPNTESDIICTLKPNTKIYFQKINEWSFIKIKKEIYYIKSEYISKELPIRRLKLTKEDLNYLYLVVGAEAEYRSKEGHKNVTYVVLNRVISNKFPNTVTEVIFQDNQFTTVANGMIYDVQVNENIRQDVNEAIEDYVLGCSASGALFFTTGSFKREYLFTDELGHNFYK